jgi:hypothetical protein
MNGLVYLTKQKYLQPLILTGCKCITTLRVLAPLAVILLCVGEMILIPLTLAAGGTLIGHSMLQLMITFRKTPLSATAKWCLF